MQREGKRPGKSDSNGSKKTAPTSNRVVLEGTKEEKWTVKTLRRLKISKTWWDLPKMENEGDGLKGTTRRKWDWVGEGLHVRTFNRRNHRYQLSPWSLLLWNGFTSLPGLRREPRWPCDFGLSTALLGYLPFLSQFQAHLFVFCDSGAGNLQITLPRFLAGWHPADTPNGM